MSDDKTDKLKRDNLKKQFAPGAIPSATDFANLIDASLNRVDDGVFKERDQPLGVVAATAGMQQTLRLYPDYPPQKHAWAVALKPDNKPGFGIVDAQDKTRLCIDAQGTVTVAGKLEAGAAEFKGTLKVLGAASVGGSLQVGPGPVRRDPKTSTPATPYLSVDGDIDAGGSALFFTDINHNFNPRSDKEGWASIQNASNYTALMILGRTLGGSAGRVVKLYDHLIVDQSLKVANRPVVVGDDGERLRIVRGTVTVDGANLRLTGKGFTCTRADNDHKLYAITFSPAFSATPSLLARPQQSGGSTWDATDGIMVQTCLPNIVTLKATQAQSFSFIAVGPV